MDNTQFLLFFIPFSSILIGILISLLVITDDEFAYIISSIKYRAKNRYHCKKFRRNSCPYSFYDTNAYCKCNQYEMLISEKAKD